MEKLEISICLMKITLKKINNFLYEHKDYIINSYVMYKYSVCIIASATNNDGEKTWPLFHLK